MLVKDVIYPFLANNTKSIVEAKRLCYEVQQLLTQEFQTRIAAEQKRISESKTSEIALNDTIKKGDGFKIDRQLYDLLKDEPLAVTNALLGGMSNALDSFVNEEMSNRHLNSVKSTFL